MQSQLTSEKAPSLWQRSANLSRPLTFVLAFMLVAFIVGIVGLFVDQQLITGAPAWLKPLKFAISISVYVATIIFLLQFLILRPRLVKFVEYVTAVSLVIEMIIIALQIIRGTTSHFNMTTFLNAALFDTMGGFILAVWVAAIILAIVLLFQPFTDPVWAWTIRLGLIATILGMAVGGLMLAPTHTQIASIQQIHSLPISGAHSVGVADGGPGLPFLGWSTVGGDLRVPHFFGLHALQVLLIIGWFISRSQGWLTVRHRVALIFTAALSYVSIGALLVWQALRGQSIVQPDAATVIAFAGVVLATIIAVAIIVSSGRHSTQTATVSHA